MLSSNALKHDINISASLYRGAVILLLYCFPLALLASIFQTLLAYSLCLGFFLVALYLAIQTSKKTDALTVTEDGVITLPNNAPSTTQFTIKTASFYNGLFLYISLEHKKGIIEKKSNYPARLILFRDSINEQDYRLIARLINQS